jgi:hypothetical protein
MSGVQQKIVPPSSGQITLDGHGLSTGADAASFQSALDLEQVIPANQEIENVVRAERARLQVEPPLKSGIEEKISTNQKFNELEQEAARLRRAASLEDQVEKIPQKRQEAPAASQGENPPVINRKRAQPLLNLQVRPEPIVKPEAREPKAAAVPTPRPSEIQGTNAALKTDLADRNAVAAEKITAFKTPSISPATPEVRIPQSTISPNTSVAPSQAAVVSANPQEAISVVHDPGLNPSAVELEMAQKPDAELSLEQAMKLDLSKAKIGTGVSPKTLTFRGHSIGSGTPLDKFITMLADFIKKLEMRFFSFLDRKHLERKNLKIKKVEEKELEEEDLQLASFSRTLSKERRKRNRLFSRFRR